MTEFLVRRFVKEPDAVDLPEVREQYGVLSGVTGIFCNLLLCAAKITVGLLSASISILADGLNNLSDIASSVITLTGFKLAGKTPDKEHPFGHGRMEYVAGLLVAMAILLVGAELLQSSVGKILSPAPTEISAFAVWILAISVLLKLWLYLFYRKLSCKIRSAAMRTSARDSLCDAASTAVVLVGALTLRFGGYNIDGWTGVLVSLFILYTGFSSAKETLNPLLGQAPSKDFTRGVQDIVLSHPEVVGVHELIVHDYGPGHCMISLHAEVPASMGALEAHNVMDKIEEELQEKYHCVATLHMDPIVMDNELTNTLKCKIQSFLNDISPELSMHDFRITDAPLHRNIIFDIVLPLDFPVPEEEIVKELRARIRQLNPNYFTVIHIVHSYI